LPLTVYQIDPEPFVVVAYEGGRHVGKYQLKSLVTDELESRWYKPYELRFVLQNEYRTLFHSPILRQYILTQYGDDALAQFHETIANRFGVI
jgi:hypothetical protein